MENTLNLEQASAKKAPENSSLSWLKTHGIVVVIYALVLIGGATLRFATWDRYFPHIDYSDEAVYVALGEHLRGISDQSSIIQAYGTLAPAYITLSAGFQEIHDAFKTVSWDLPADNFPVARGFSVIMGIMTIAVLMWGGTIIAGKEAGIFAGAVWAFSPIVVNINSLAVPDPPLYLTCAVAIVAAIAAWKYDSPKLLFLSLLMGILAIYLKIWVAMAIVPFIVAAVLVLIRNPRPYLLWLPVYVITAGFTAWHMVFVLNPLQTTMLLATNSGNVLDNVTSLTRLNNTWVHLQFVFGNSIFPIGVVGGILAFIWNYRHKRHIVSWQMMLILIAYMVSGFLLTTTISQVTLSGGRMRHLLPTAIGFILFWSVCISQILNAVADELRRRNFPATLLAPGIALLLVGVIALDYIPGNLAVIEKFDREYITNVVRNWFDISVPRDGIAMQPYQGDLDSIWNRWWGAYAGNRPFDYWSENQEQILATSPQDYVDRNIKYFVIGDGDFAGTRYNDPALQDWLDELTLVKTFDATGENLAGTTSYVYRMLPPQHDADFNYGDIITLDGYDLSTFELSPGETLVFRPYWRITQQPEINYTMFIHLYPEDEFVQQAQYDGQPVAETYPTTLWDDEDELYINHDVHFMIPEDLPAGEYRFAVGLYDVNTLQRLKDGAEEFFIIPLTIE